MSQTVLSKDDGTPIKKQTKLERLYLLRNNYFVDLNRKLERLKDRRKELIMDYKNTAKDIDKEIEIELRRIKNEQNKSEETNKI